MHISRIALNKESTILLPLQDTMIIDHNCLIINGFYSNRKEDMIFRILKIDELII